MNYIAVILLSLLSFLGLKSYWSLHGPGPGPGPKPMGTNAQDSWNLSPWAFWRVRYVLALNKSIILPLLLSLLGLKSYWSLHGPGPGPGLKPTGTNAQDTWHLSPWAFWRVHYVLVLNKSNATDVCVFIQYKWQQTKAKTNIFSFGMAFHAMKMTAN